MTDSRPHTGTRGTRTGGTGTARRRGAPPALELDVASGVVRIGGRSRRLRPKAVEVLRYLGDRPAQVIAREQIVAALWPGVRVSDGVLKVHVWELRRALGDRHRPPRFIETLPRRGYRWLAGPIAPAHDAGAADARAGAPGCDGGKPLVGRERDLARLDAALSRALVGRRQVMLLTGEPGIGKTTLAEAFLRRASALPGVCAAAGHCIDHSGAAEPYLPVLAAVGELLRGRERRRVVRVLRRHAPAWLPQLPAVGRDPAAPAPAGATRSRMVRQLAEAIEALAARRGLVLLLEDLQWSDAPTIDLLVLLARRSAPARLLLLATHRPGDVGPQHPLAAATQEIWLRDPAAELALGCWSEADVAQYLDHSGRFDLRVAQASRLARAIHRRTEGNPLFVANVVDALASDGEGAPASRTRAEDLAGAERRVHDIVPRTLREMIDRRIDRLPREDRAALEAASAIGRELSAAALAAALEASVEVAEERCAVLARRAQLLRRAGEEEWPDGTIAGRYAFVHELYRAVLLARLPPARRVRLHRRIAERLEAAHGVRSAEVAPELAAHWEAAREPVSAVRHLEVAADNALRRHAEVEAAHSLGRALDLLRALPESPERVRRELSLLLRRGAPLLMTRGYGAPEVVETYRRALDLCAQVGDSPELLMALAGAFRFSLVRSELGTARSIAARALAFAERNPFPVAELAAHFMMGMATFARGEFAAGRKHFEASLARYDPVEHRLLALTYGDDPGVACLAEHAMALWFLGHPDRALVQSDAALARAREVGIPYSLAFALTYATWCRLLRREAAAAVEHAETLVRLAAEHEFEYWVAQGTTIRGWVRVDCGDLEAGTADLVAGLAAYERLGAQVMRPWHQAKLAEAHVRAGRREEGLREIDDALAAMGSQDERFYEAEILRWKGELALAARPADAAARGLAESCFEQAIEVSRRQQARSLELRAATSLARLWQRTRRSGEARRLLAAIHGGFDEGGTSGDLREASRLLAALG